MTQLPREPVGNDPLVQSVRQLIRCLRERTILPDPSLDIDHLAHGTRVRVRTKARGGSSETSGGNEPARWA